MLLLPRRLIRSALLVGCLGLLLPAIAIAQPPTKVFRISDEAKMFTKDTLDKADLKVQQIKRDYNKDVFVETLPKLPPAAMKSYDSAKGDKEKTKFWRDFAGKRYADEGVSGVYVLITKEPSHLRVHVGEKTIKKAFTEKNRSDAQTILVDHFKKDDFDIGLLTVLDQIDTSLGRNIDKVKSSTSPIAAKTSAAANTAVSGIWGMICIGLVVVLALWLVVGLFRAFTGAGNRPVDRPQYGNQGGGGQQGGGGYAPQQQGGGGGFLKGMLGGMLGAAGGMYLYDTFLRGNSPSAGPSATPSAYGSSTPDDGDRRGSDTGEGADWSSGNKTRDDGGADWGKKDDDGGGGSFGGGGDDGGGGSFGGGGDDGGGGSFGGGDGGGGGDW